MLKLFIPLGMASALFLECAMPTRHGYDRDRGTYKTSPSRHAISSKIQDKNLERIIRPWLGTPYKYGGQSKKGIDCSGFVQIVMEAYKGIRLPRSTSAAYKEGASVDLKNLQTGDVVYFGSFWGIDHAGVWLGEGRFVHASTSSGVMVSHLESDPYWKGRYRGARRYG